MRVARSVTPREVRMEDVPEPVPGPDEVLCRVVACGVCGSDVSEAWVARKVPVVLGHEVVGIVEAVGAQVPAGGPGVGEAVVIHHHAPCGTCRRCARGHETLCDRFRSTALDPGGFAQKVRVPADLVAELLPIGALDPERASFVEPLACVLRALDRATLREGETLLVVGAGTSGLLAVAAALARGAGRVEVREPRPERMALAERLGGLPHAGGLVDVALVCTPAPAAIADGFAALGPGGALCLYAPPKPGETLALPAWELFMGEIEVHASYSAGPGDMRAALALIASGRVDPAPLVTHRLGLDETARALELQRTGEAVKALVLP
jgi:L-iditol 2-dehydrogenase